MPSEINTTVLIVDDEEHILLSCDTILRMNGFNTHLCSDSTKALAVLEQQDIHLVLLDLNLPGLPGNELLGQIVQKYPNIPVIIVTGDSTIDMAVACMKAGAFDYILKPLNKDRLLTLVRQAESYSKMIRENPDNLEERPSKKLQSPEFFSFIVTDNTTMIATFNYLEATARTNQPVLITGETGTGKELLAKAVHDVSGRKGEMVCVNVAGLDDHNFSDTMFGHTKGAFTGATEKRSGLVEKAAGGTLFLDEMGDLSPTSQIKLLRLLQEQEYHPLGSDTPKYSKARIVAATNRNLEELHLSKTFRRDLYFRLLAHNIYLPPLRDRKDDLPLLVNHFLEEAAKEYGIKKPRVDRGLLPLLNSYGFPGNIRELRAMIFNAMSQADSGSLPMTWFKAHIKNHTNAGGATATWNNQANKPLEFGVDLPTMDEAKGLLIEEALVRSKGNKSHAAALLGMSRQAIILRNRQKDA